MEYTYQLVNDDGEILELVQGAKLVIGDSLVHNGDLWCVVKLLKEKHVPYESSCRICKKGSLFVYRQDKFRCNFCLAVVNRSGQREDYQKIEKAVRPSGFKPKPTLGPAFNDLEVDKRIKHADWIVGSKLSTTEEAVKNSRVKSIGKKPKRYKIGNSYV